MMIDIVYACTEAAWFNVLIFIHERLTRAAVDQIQGFFLKKVSLILFKTVGYLYFYACYLPK